MTSNDKPFLSCPGKLSHKMFHWNWENKKQEKTATGRGRGSTTMNVVVASDPSQRPYSGGYGGAWEPGTGAVKSPEQDENATMTDRSTKGCWAQFSSCIGGLWATREITKKDNREAYVRTTLRELVVYIIFLTILCIITFGMTSSTMFYYTKVLSDLFLDSPYADTRNTFRGSTQVLDVWRFLEMTVLDSLYWEYWYDPAMTPTENDDNNILYENRMLGVPRMRQLRVKNDSCLIPDDFKRVIRQCYSEYSAINEDTNPFGKGNRSIYPTAWKYHTEEELHGISHWGKLTVYSGAGSYVDMFTTKNETRELFMTLREMLWIDRGTRALFIDTTVYNANINLFCIIKLVVEFPATGGIIPSWTFRTVKLLRYVTQFDYFIMACEFIFVLFIIYYIIEEVLEISRLRFSYFCSMWNILDLVVIGLCVVCIGYNIFLVMSIQSMLEVLLSNPKQYANYEQLGFRQIQFTTATSVCVFFSWLKLFKYISFNKTMTQLSSTLSRCAKDVVGFCIMFYIVFFAFAQLGYLLFGTQVQDFSSFMNAVFTLMRTILGDFNFHAIEEANRILGPVFFFAYVFFVFFVLMNMFLAIINDTYSEVKTEIASEKNEFEIADYFKQGYNNMLGKLGHRDKLIDLKNILLLCDTDADGMLSFEEVRTSLKRCNFSDMEIEMFFSKYDIDGDRLLRKDEVKLMIEDLNQRSHQEQRKPQPQIEAQRPLSSKSEGRPATTRTQHQAGVAKEEHAALSDRVADIEGTIVSIVSRIDVVLKKLDLMERNKHKRKEDIGKKMEELFTDHRGEENK